MNNSDVPVVLVVETLLLLFTLFVIVRDVRIRALEKTAEVSVDVTRGDKSMNALYTAYGASVASSLVLIANAEGLDGHKVVLIVLPFLCLTYLFYLSIWFRNSIFFPLAQKMRNK
jgi:hypothetical protein